MASDVILLAMARARGLQIMSVCLPQYAWSEYNLQLSKHALTA